MIRIIVPGVPVPQNSSWARPNCQAYKKAVAVLAKREMAGCEPISAGVVEIDFFLPIPNSWTLKKSDAAKAGVLRPTVKPDILDLVRAVKEALKGIVYEDGARVIEIHVSKSYSDEPRTEIVIDSIDMPED
jgi:Holliday junction resolvase RusA-like endonuclease